MKKLQKRKETPQERSVREWQELPDILRNHWKSREKKFREEFRLTVRNCFFEALTQPDAFVRYHRILAAMTTEEGRKRDPNNYPMMPVHLIERLVKHGLNHIVEDDLGFYVINIVILSQVYDLIQEWKETNGPLHSSWQTPLKQAV